MKKSSASGVRPDSANSREARPAVDIKTMPYHKYKPFRGVELADRTWPTKQLTQAPRWCSVDLRDGNQALIEPMNPREKMYMFELLLEIGFKEIEVGFPAASQPDFDFVRTLIDKNLIPEDVTIQVLCQAREELIDLTTEALSGAPRAIFHIYNSTSTLQRKVVFGMDQRQIIDLALQGIDWIAEKTQVLTDTDLTLEYSPESFTGTETDFAIEICEAVCTRWWDSGHEEKVIINLPATVELATPNAYADQIEYFCRNFAHRDRVVISLHTHNDRGTGVAASELGLLAGAERVEGTLFGNGERTGNADLVALAMNFFSQGMDPRLDLTDMPRIVEVAQSCNKLPVHARHPYAGELVFTAFSGSHQDAIRKGFAQLEGGEWAVPYLPIDPTDVKSSYRETVRVNSQSGKGGVAFLLEENFGVTLTRPHLIEFAGITQALSEQQGGELTPTAIWQAFVDNYASREGHYRLIDYQLVSDQSRQQCRIRLAVGNREMSLEGTGAGPIEAFVEALRQSLNESFEISDYHEQALGEGSDAKALAQIAIRSQNKGIFFGIGISKNTVTASFEAILASLNRRWKSTR